MATSPFVNEYWCETCQKTIDIFEVYQTETRDYKPGTYRGEVVSILYWHYFTGAPLEGGVVHKVLSRSRDIVAVHLSTNTPPYKAQCGATGVSLTKDQAIVTCKRCQSQTD
jgi:hypothetical protein